MKNLFKHTSSGWVRYSKYEWKEDKNNKYYITPRHRRPCRKLNFRKKSKAPFWFIDNDRTMMALALTFRKEPQAQIMCSMLVDETAALKLCPNCYKAFFAEKEDDIYCSEACKVKDQQ